MTGIHITASANLHLAHWHVWCRRNTMTAVCSEDGDYYQLGREPGALRAWSGFASDQEAALRAV